MKSVLTSLAKSVLLPFGLSAMSATDTAIQKNEEIEEIMKIVKSLEESGLLKMELVKQLKMKQKKKVGFFAMLLGTLAASILRNVL